MLKLSVIIPTFNRIRSLRRALRSLEGQLLNPAQFQVIVVDDGSSDDTERLEQASFPFNFKYVRQTNRGSAVARNRGAKEAAGKVLVFIDDDMTLNTEYLTGLLQEHQRSEPIVAMGTLITIAPEPLTPFAATQLAREEAPEFSNRSQRVNFTDCTTNNLSVEKDHFLEIGMFHDVAGDGRSLWGDVDFGYRAMKNGMEFRQSGYAKCYHHDYSLKNFDTALSRSYETGITAAAMGARIPEVIAHLPMFLDKHPIQLESDSPSLIIRKLARRLASSQPVARPLRGATRLMESVFPASKLITSMYRWALGAELTRGYRDGQHRLRKAASG